MIPLGLERKPDLETSDALRVFGVRQQDFSSVEGLQRLCEQLPAWLAESAKESRLECCALDLRGVDFHSADMQTLNELATHLAASGWRLVCIGTPAVNGSTSEGAPSFAVVSGPEELYEWVVQQGLRKRATSPVPLFSMTAEELADLRANGISLGDLLHELEAKQDSA